jgi:hypothetical protein
VGGEYCSGGAGRRGEGRDVRGGGEESKGSAALEPGGSAWRIYRLLSDLVERRYLGPLRRAIVKRGRVPELKQLARKHVLEFY